MRRELNYTKGEWCACGVKDLGERVYQIKYCPKHKAAPALYEALKDLLNIFDRDLPEGTIGWHTCNRATKALSRAEGK